MLRRASGALIRLVILVALVALVGWGIGQAGGQLLARLPDTSGATAIDHFTLAAGLSPDATLVQQADLPKEWTPGAPTFGFLGANLCGMKAGLVGAKTNRLPTHTWVDSKVGSVLVSEVVEFTSVQFASTYMSKVDSTLGKCDHYFVVNGTARQQMDVSVPTVEDPVDDYVSRIIQPKDRKSYSILTAFQAGRTVVGIQYRGPIRPDRDLINNVVNKVLRRIDPDQFATTSTTITGAKKLPEKTVVSIDSAAISTVPGGDLPAGAPAATIPPTVPDLPPSSVAPEVATTARSSQGN